MQIRNIHKAFLFFILLFASVVHSAIITRLTTFTDGSILTASDLNSEFNNVVNGVNSIDNDNIASGANISPAKISAVIAGDGIGRDSGTGALEVNDDATTLEISSDTLRVKDNGISNAKIRQSAGLSVIGRSANTTGNVADITASSDSTVLQRAGTSIGFATVPTAAIADSAITSIKIADTTIATGDIADGAITQAKRASLGQQISSSSGAYSTSSTSFADVTNLSVTLTTTGRPVLVFMTASDASPGSSFDGSIYVDPNCTTGTTTACTTVGTMQLLRDGSAVAVSELSAVFSITFGVSSSAASIGTRAPCSTFQFIDIPSSGSRTYKMQAAIETGSNGTFGIQNCKLVAFEL